MEKSYLLPEGKYAQLSNGYKIHYLDEGTGPVVVYLHGSGVGASGYSNFKTNYPFLVQAGYRCVILDLIGYGFSDKPDDIDYPTEFFVECVKQTLDTIGVKHSTLVGNSLGGAIAIQYTLDYPKEVGKLILMAPGGIEERADYFKMEGQVAMKQSFTSGQPMTLEFLRSLLEKYLVYAGTCITDSLVAERLEILKLQNSRVLATMKVPNFERKLPEIHCPVLAFWGTHEKMMPETGILKLAKSIPKIRLILVSECGHWVMLEHEDMFNRMCLDFLSEV